MGSIIEEDTGEIEEGVEGEASPAKRGERKRSRDSSIEDSNDNGESETEKRRKLQRENDDNNNIADQEEEEESEEFGLGEERKKPGERTQVNFLFKNLNIIENRGNLVNSPAFNFQ